MPPAPALVLAGPTASGKSALALALARELDGVVINADSMQVYRELRVLTARPSAAEEVLAPHRLYGVLPAAERCSAGRWRALAIDEIAAARAAGKRPILVGGTGLYLRALIDGLAPIPPVPPAIRAAARARRDAIGPEAFHAELARRDPAAAARLAPGDTQRVLRAWEVVEATGRTLASFTRDAGAPQDPGDARVVLLLPPPAVLDAAIAARCARMLDAGALDEVRPLLALDLDPLLPAMKAVGVRELGAWLRGAATREAALERFRIATRQYAKRQRTWFRHQLRADRVLSEQFSESLLPEIFRFVREKV